MSVMDGLGVFGDRAVVLIHSRDKQVGGVAREPRRMISSSSRRQIRD